MKNNILRILLFIFVAVQSLAITDREKITKDLQELNIEQDLISKTITITEKIGDKNFNKKDKDTVLKELKELVDKNPKNFYLTCEIVRYYLETEQDIEEIKKNRKYFDVYEKYVTQDYEKLLTNLFYYEKIGDKKQEEKYYNEFIKKYWNKWVGKFFLSRDKKDFKSIKEDIALSLELLKEDMKNGNKDEITDEELFYIQNTYDNVLIEEMLEKKEYQEIVDYYINNMANQDYYTQGVLNKYSDRLTSQFHMIMDINQEFLKSNENNKGNLFTSKVFYELNRLGKIIIIDKS